MGNLLASVSPKEDKLLEKYGATFIGSVGIKEVEYHIWGHTMDNVGVLEELDILKEELQQAYSEIERLKDHIRRIPHKVDEEKVMASWRGCVDRQGGAFDAEEINREVWQ